MDSSIILYLQNPAVMRILLAAGADPDLQDDNGETPLTVASWNGKTGIVELLLWAGANPNIRGRLDQTALTDASAIGHVGGRETPTGEWC